MFDDLKLMARDEDEMEDFRGYDDDTGSEPAKLDEYDDSQLDDEEDEVIVVATPVELTEIIEVAEGPLSAPSSAPARKPAKKARKATPAPTKKAAAPAKKATVKKAAAPAKKKAAAKKA